MQNTQNNKKFDLINIREEYIKERFDTKSILGIKVAGKTSKLDNIYIILFCLKKEIIF